MNPFSNVSEMGNCLFVASKRSEDLAQQAIYRLLADSTAPEQGYSNEWFLCYYQKFIQSTLSNMPLLLPELRNIVQAYYLPDIKIISKEALADHASNLPSFLVSMNGPLLKNDKTLLPYTSTSRFYALSPFIFVVNNFKYDYPPSMRAMMDYIFIFPHTLTGPAELKFFLQYIDDLHQTRAKVLLKQQRQDQVFVLRRYPPRDRRMFLWTIPRQV